MTIDTEIRHITKAGANLFSELGFDAEEAERLQLDLRGEIDDGPMEMRTNGDLTPSLYR